MKKRLITVFMIFLVALMVLPGNSFANPENTSHEHNHDHEAESIQTGSEDEFSILYVPCPGGGRHYMQRHGPGIVRNSDGVTLFDGKAHQCSKCLEVIISQYAPRDGWNKLGKYAVKNPGYPLTQAYIMTNPSKIGTSTSLTVSPWTSYTWL